MRKMFIAMSVLVTMGALAACEVPEEDSKPVSTADKANAVAVQAKKILKEFEDNEAAADQKYKGKTLKITGVVDKVDTELFDDEEYVVRLGDGSDFVLWTVNCNDMSQAEVASVKKGKTATVIGKFDDGGDLGVDLENCTMA